MFRKANRTKKFHNSNNFKCKMFFLMNETERALLKTKILT